MIKKEKYPFKTNFNFLFKLYTFIGLGFTTWAYIYGYLYSYSFRDNLKLSQLGIPLDEVRTHINGGLLILIENTYLVIILIIAPLILIITHYSFYKYFRKIDYKNWLMKSLISQLVFYLIFFSPLLIIFFVTKPIETGEKEAKKLLLDFPHDQLVFKKEDKDSIICCKVIYFTEGYTVFIKDSVAHAISLPTGSYVYKEL